MPRKPTFDAPRTLLARKARASLVGRCVVPVHSLLWQTEPQGRFEVELTMLSTFAVILRSGRVLSVTTLLFIAVTPAASQQGDPVAIQKRFNELYAAGNYPAALVEAQKLEAGFKARFGVNHANYAIALASLADVYWRQGKYAEAEALYKRAVVIREKVLSKDHSGVADYLNNLGLILNDQGKLRRG